MSIVGGLDIHRKQITFGCAAAHSMAWQKSAVSCGDRQSRYPGDRPAPRESTRTTA